MKSREKTVTLGILAALSMSATPVLGDDVLNVPQATESIVSLKSGDLTLDYTGKQFQSAIKIAEGLDSELSKADIEDGLVFLSDLEALRNGTAEIVILGSDSISEDLISGAIENPMLSEEVRESLAAVVFQKE
ncbi:MAG: hypothetical protein GY909_05410 [Oligoflexia bacterium]|nr:hypothetical protein [Oligoflexia bacterium]